MHNEVVIEISKMNIGGWMYNIGKLKIVLTHIKDAIYIASEPAYPS